MDYCVLVDEWGGLDSLQPKFVFYAWYNLAAIIVHRVCLCFSFLTLSYLGNRKRVVLCFNVALCKGLN